MNVLTEGCKSSCGWTLEHGESTAKPTSVSKQPLMFRRPVGPSIICAYETLNAQTSHLWLVVMSSSVVTTPSVYGRRNIIIIMKESKLHLVSIDDQLLVKAFFVPLGRFSFLCSKSIIATMMKNHHDFRSFGIAFFEALSSPTELVYSSQISPISVWWWWTEAVLCKCKIVGQNRSFHSQARQRQWCRRVVTISIRHSQ